MIYAKHRPYVKRRGVSFVLLSIPDMRLPELDFMGAACGRLKKMAAIHDR